MFQNCVTRVVLIITLVSVSAKSQSPADNTTEPRPVVSEFHAESSVVNDNICNGHEKNVAFDVILFETNKTMNANHRNKRQAPHDNRNDYRDRPRPDQRSLLIVFDATGSMHDDLEQLRIGAQEIVNELSAREDNPIWNYVLVVYRDPTVEPPFDTKNPDDLLAKLMLIQTIGGGDCPEYVLSGLKLAMEFALPNSLAYVFSDATAKDLGYYEEVSALIQKKQVSVNFLLTGNCHDSSAPGYQVYLKLSRASNGQVYDMNKSNVKDVLLAIRHTVNYNYAALKSVATESAGTTNTKLNVDKSISELSVSLSGKNPTLTIKDPRNETIKAGDELSLQNLKLVKIKDPVGGLWNFESAAESSHTILLGAMSDLKFNFGFSVDVARKISETSFQPLTGYQNILSIFVSDPSLIKDLSEVTIILIPMNDHESSDQYNIPLQKVDTNIFATIPFDIPNQMFKIQLHGVDANGNLIERLLSTGLHSSKGSAPDVSIEVNQKEINELEKLLLKCVVKSHTPVNISLIFENRRIAHISSNQSNDLEFVVDRVSKGNEGKYFCETTNRFGRLRKEISIKVLSTPKVLLIPSRLTLSEGSKGELDCIIESSGSEEHEITWIDIHGKKLNQNSENLEFIATRDYNNKTLICQVQHGDSLISNSSLIFVEYPPKFISDTKTILKVTHGDSFELSCETDSNPRATYNWVFTQANSLTKSNLHQRDPRLRIKTMNGSSQGIYECVVENSLGSAYRKFEVFDYPKGSPKILMERDVIIVNETDSIDLNCESIDSLPMKNFSWYNENANNYERFVIQDEINDVFQSVLRIPNIDESDNGSFECYLANEIGHDKFGFELLVQTAAKIDSLILKSKGEQSEIESETSVLEDDEVFIDCDVDGFPVPEVKWFKGQDEIESKETTLIFKKIKESDSGNYHCLATNILAMTTKSFHLQVFTPPKTNDSTELIVKVFEKEKVELNCNIEGNPRPKLSWSANENPINKRMKLSKDSKTLSFDAQLTDSGMYFCLGSNQFGTLSINFTVLVFGTPRILLPNDEQRKSKLGDRSVLSCDASGFPQPQIIWTKNEKYFKNGSEIEFAQISQNDSGVYRCEASNEVGSTQKVFYLTVVHSPKITNELTNVTIFTNEEANVLCETTGSPIPDISWNFDGVIISIGPKLTLTSSMPSGLYVCTAENSEGKVDKSFFFNAINKPTLIPNHDELKKEIKLREGDGLELLCPFENFNSISWKFNNKSTEELATSQNHNKLTLHKVDRVLSGDWMCIVSNLAGNDSFSFNVSVLASPVIHASWNLNSRVSEFLVTESDIDEKSFKVGETLNLNCTAHGYPKPKVIWRKASDKIAEGENLIIDDLQFHHSDIYTCSAENDQGVVKKFFKIDVVSHPLIEDSDIQKNFQMAIGDSLTLKCKFTGNPIPNIFWFKDNVLLDDETDTFLELPKLTLDNDGTYKCIAKNAWGREVIEFDVSMMESAKIIQAQEEPKVSRTDDSMKLSCTVRGNPLPVVSWISNGHILSTTSKLNIEKLFSSVEDSKVYFNGYGNSISYLDPFMLKTSKEKFYSQLTKLSENSLKLDVVFRERDLKVTGTYQCYAYNALGRDDKKVEINIYEKPFVNEKQMKSLDEIEVLEGLPLLLSCLMSGEPKPQISWYKGTTQLHSNETIKFLNGNRFLSISESFLWNSGNYSCKAVNEVGERTLDFQVSVLAPPRFIDYSVAFSSNSNHLHNDKIKIDQKKNELKVMKGDDVTLECRVDGTSPIVHWLKLDFYDSSQNEVIEENDSTLVIQSIQESTNFMCYVNNTIGNIQKIFQIIVQFPPSFIDNKKLEHHHSTKMHHGINLNCKVEGNPEPKTKWTFNSTDIAVDDKNFYFSDDNQILRIIDSKKSNQGKYLCTAENDFGKVERVFYLNIEVPIQWSAFGPWTTCSVSCGSGGIQYRTRICLLSSTGHPATAEDYKCVGENVETRKCNRLQCPVNGGWGNFSNWSDCPVCVAELTQELPILSRRSRKCDNPQPSNGGLECSGAESEEVECQVKYCKVNGGWSEWGSWSSCSKTCGVSHRMRKRLCSNPAPKRNGTYCEGENVEYEDCKLAPCKIEREFKKAFNSADEDELEDRSNESRFKYGEAAEFEFNDLNGVTRNFQFMKHSEVKVSPPPDNENGFKLPKIKVTLDTYKPISEETYNHHVGKAESREFETESTSLENLNRQPQKTCMRGFVFNAINDQCEDINECQKTNLNSCTTDERCINLLGTYRCDKKVRRSRKTV